jgi:hypothetical protein
MLGDIGCCTAVFTAKGEALDETQQHQTDRSGDAGRLVIRQQPDAESGSARELRRNVYLRPTRSPMWPKTMAPNGRTTKPVAKVAKVSMKASVGLSFEAV